MQVTNYYYQYKNHLSQSRGLKSFETDISKRVKLFLPEIDLETEMTRAVTFQDDINDAITPLASWLPWKNSEEDTDQDAVSVKKQEKFIKLAKEGRQLKEKIAKLNETIEKTEKEIEGFRSKDKPEVVEQGQNLIREKTKQYLEANIAWSKNLIDQIKCLDEISGKKSSLNLLEAQIECWQQALKDIAAEEEKAVKPSILPSLTSVTTAMLRAADQILFEEDEGTMSTQGEVEEKETIKPAEEPKELVQTEATVQPAEKPQESGQPGVSVQTEVTSQESVQMEATVQPAEKPQESGQPGVSVQTEVTSQESVQMEATVQPAEKPQVRTQASPSIQSGGWLDSFCTLMDQVDETFRNKVDQELEESKGESAQSVESWIEDFLVPVDNVLDAAINKAEEAFSSASGVVDASARVLLNTPANVVQMIPSASAIVDAAASVASALVGPSKEQVQLVDLMDRLKKGHAELKEEDLILLSNELPKMKKMKDQIQQRGLGGIQREIEQFLAQNPMVSKPAVEALAFTLGFAAGGPVGAVAARLAAGKAMNVVAPKSPSYASQVAGAVVQSIGAYLTNGVVGAAVSAGVTAFQTQAPTDVQALAVGGAAGYMAYAAGLAAPVAMPLSMMTMLVYKNESLFKSIAADMKHAWNVIRHQPLRIVPEVGRGLKNQVVDSTWGVVRAIKAGRKIEAITRIAGYAIAAVGLALSAWTLPLMLMMFYMINRTYRANYEGHPDLGNESFRRYVVKEFNQHTVKNAAALRDILEVENTELKDLCDLLDAYQNDQLKID